MTEADRWSDDPNAMLGFLQSNRVGDVRRLLLFACAAVRRIWPLLVSPTWRGAIEVAERYADGAEGVEALAAAQNSLRTFSHSSAPSVSAKSACWYAVFGWGTDPRRHQKADLDYGWSQAGRVCEEARYAAALSADHDAKESGRIRGQARRDAKREESQAQAALLRDIFGPRPLRPAPPIDPGVLSWSGGLVLALARAAYEDRLLHPGHLDPDRLTVLADALEEAGHTDPELLGHLRGPGPHVRGCWGVDAVLGRA